MTTRSRLSVVGHNIHGNAPRSLADLTGHALPFLDGRQLCAQADPELWFPDRGGSAHPQVVAAKQICRQCPLVDACREWSIESGERYGVWGALSERERRAERIRRGIDTSSAPAPKPAACGTDSGYYRHIRKLVEPACDECLAAHAAAGRDRIARGAA